MHYTKYSIAHYVLDVEVLIVNSYRQPAIKKAVDKYGYDEAMLDVLKEVHQDLVGVLDEQAHAKSVKRDLYAERTLLKKQVQKVYMKYLKLARIAFVDDLKIREALLLDGERMRTYNEWLFQVAVFCSNLTANQDWLSLLKRYGIARHDIVELDNWRNKLIRLTEKCIEAKGEVKRLTESKHKKVIEVQSCVSDYIKIARIALENKPKLLNCLGINVKG